MPLAFCQQKRLPPVTSLATEFAGNPDWLSIHLAPSSTHSETGLDWRPQCQVGSPKLRRPRTKRRRPPVCIVLLNAARGEESGGRCKARERAAGAYYSGPARRSRSYELTLRHQRMPVSVARIQRARSRQCRAMLQNDNQKSCYAVCIRREALGQTRSISKSRRTHGVA